MENLHNLEKLIAKRRSIYALSPHSTLEEQQIIELLHAVLKYTPSAFDSRSTRLVLLTGNAHLRFWNIVKAALREITSPDVFARSENKIDTFFASGYGTILFFEDWAVVRDMQSRFATYRDNFPIWSAHTSAMHQYAIWVALADAGMGASLQHYNPLIDKRVREEWQLSEDWQLVAQMPFGVGIKPAPAKDFGDFEKQFLFFTE